MFVWIFIYLIVFSTHALTREISIHTIPRTPRIRTKFKRIHFRPPKHARSVSPGSTTTAVIFPPIPERREDAQGPSQCRGAIGNAWGDTFRWTMYVHPFRISQFLYLKQLTDIQLLLYHQSPRQATLLPLARIFTGRTIAPINRSSTWTWTSTRIYESIMYAVISKLVSCSHLIAGHPPKECVTWIIHPFYSAE